MGLRDLAAVLTGTGAQLKGPFNCVPSGSQAAAYFAVRAITDPTIPTRMTAATNESVTARSAASISKPLRTDGETSTTTQKPPPTIAWTAK